VAAKPFDLLQLLNTGTVAQSRRPTRILQPKAYPDSRTACAERVELPYRAVKANIAESLNIVVQMERRPGARFVAEILEIRGFDLATDNYNLRVVHAQRPYAS